MAMKLVTFVVEGAGEMPFDMLRYDACYPSSSQTAADCSVIGPLGRERRRISLEHRTDQSVAWLKTNYPTAARWRSFGWSVVPGSIEIRNY